MLSDHGVCALESPVWRLLDSTRDSVRAHLAVVPKRIRERFENERLQLRGAHSQDGFVQGRIRTFDLLRRSVDEKDLKGISIHSRDPLDDHYRGEVVYP